MKRWTPAVLLALGALLGVSAAEARIIGRGAEVSIGRETASMVEQYLPVDRDPAAVARVRSVGRRLAACVPDTPYAFEFHVVEQGEINAFALPGGYIYVYRGLLQLLPSDDALASVLAHEISHVTERHSIRQFEKSLLLSAGISAILQGTGARGFGNAAYAVQTIVGLSFTRGDEGEADTYGVRLLARAGYDPRAAAEAMRVVKRGSPEGGSIPNLLRSHPAPDSRIRKLDELGRELLKERDANRKDAPAPPPPPAAATPRLRGLDGVRVEVNPWYPLATEARWSYRVRSAAEGPDAVLSVRVLEPIAAEPSGAFRVEVELSGIRSRRVVVPAGNRCLWRPETAAPAEPWQEEALIPEVTGTESVTVPGGTFQAVRVERGGDGARTVSWYARGVGLVKRVSPSGAEQELVSFSVPGM